MISKRKKIFAGILAVVILFSISCYAFAEIRLDATILPESDKPLQAVFTINTDALGVLIPTQEDTYYLIYWEDVPDILSQILGFELDMVDKSKLDDQLLSTLALRYGKIIISVAGIFNLSRKKINYELSAFHTNPKCILWTCAPSQRDWSKMLTKLFDTALSDDDLKAVLSTEGMSIIREGQNHINDMVHFLEGFSFQVAADDNNIYAVKISRNGEGICYQYPGVPSSEHAIVYEKDGNSSILVYVVSDLNSAGIQVNPRRINSAQELTEVLSVFLTLFPNIAS